MYVNNLKLINFRNYQDLQVEFDKNFNIIYGFNGQGKTNILEALFLCASGRSHRTSKDAELINFFNKEAYHIKTLVKKEHSDLEIEIFYKKGNKKNVRINEIPLKKIGDLMGKLNAVMFSPEDLLIVKEGPSERRRFIDITISQLRPAYFFDLQQYNKILSQRNYLLKEIREKNSNIDTLDAWNYNLVKVASKIIIRRNEFVKRLSILANQNHQKITDGNEFLQINYNPSFAITNIESIEESFLDILERNKEKEILKGITLYGPHRDDYDIMLNDLNLKMYGSQGQQRTSVLSIKMAEIDIMREDTGENPILLLDDVASELDNRRQEYFFNSIKNIQTFITCTDKDLFQDKKLEKYRYYNVTNGNVIY